MGTPNPLARVEAALSARLVEREREAHALVLALIAREHVLLVGPPGTAKSFMTRQLAGLIEGARYCERLLSPTAPPEELFGPISLAALRADQYRHVGAGTATDAHILFLDEVWRAGDAIRDTLLHLLGPERQALIGTEQVRVPLITAVGASNTYATEADGAAALDRWLIRLFVRPPSPGARRQMFEGRSLRATPTVPVATLADIEAAAAAARTLAIPPATLDRYEDILARLEADGVIPSPRRADQALSVAQAEAVLRGAEEVLPQHLEPLRHVLWDRPEDEPTVARHVLEVACPELAEIERLLSEATDAQVRATDQNTRLEAVATLTEIERRLAVLANAGNGRGAAALRWTRGARIRIQAVQMNLPVDKVALLLGGDA